MTPESAADWLALVGNLGGPATAIVAAAGYVLAIHRGWLVTRARFEAEKQRAEYWRAREADNLVRTREAEVRAQAATQRAEQAELRLAGRARRRPELDD